MTRFEYEDKYLIVVTNSAGLMAYFSVWEIVGQSCPDGVALFGEDFVDSETGVPRLISGECKYDGHIRFDFNPDESAFVELYGYDDTRMFSRMLLKVMYLCIRELPSADWKAAGFSS